MWISEHYTSANFYVVSSTSDKKTHIVSWGENQYLPGVQKRFPAHAHPYDWSCTCKDWKFHRQSHGGYCKHILSKFDKRVLWATDDESELIWRLDSVDLSRLRKLTDLTITGENVSLLAYAQVAEHFLSSTKPYVPIVDESGKHVPAIKVTPKEYRELMQDERNAPLTNGELSADQFVIWLTYVIGQTESNAVACFQAGFDPGGDFILSASDADSSTPCGKCGAHMVKLDSIDPLLDGYVCVNPLCEISVNNTARRQQRIQFLTPPPALRLEDNTKNVESPHLSKRLPRLG